MDLISLKLAAEVAGVEYNTVNQWIARDLPGCTPDGEFITPINPGRGGVRKVSLSFVVQLAVAQELIRVGVSARQALLVALKFSDMGAAKIGFVENRDDQIQSVDLPRDPGRLFPAGYGTWLVYAGLHDSAIVADPSKDPMSFRAGFEAAYPGYAPRDRPAGRIVVDLDRVCRRVANGLGINFAKSFITEP